MVWTKDRDLNEEGFFGDSPELESALKRCASQTEEASDVTELLLIEAQLAKDLYKIAANTTKNKDFSRDRNSFDNANTFLNHGNYLAYGISCNNSLDIGDSSWFCSYAWKNSPWSFGV